MTLKIKDTEVTLRWTFRSLMLYENIQKKSFQPTTTSDVLVFMFCAIISSAPQDLEFNFNEFLDMIDENPNLVTEFSEWLSKQMIKDETLSPEEEKKTMNK